MSYMNCPRCGMSVRLRAPYLLPDRCPRCAARSGVSVPLEVTDQPQRRFSPRSARRISPGFAAGVARTDAAPDLAGSTGGAPSAQGAPPSAA
jgi:hypothetical protein